jgi:galactokinase
VTDPVALFGRRFGAEPSHEARAPGRVNLVGDHIDYHDLPVLPMALKRHVRIVFRPRSDGRVHLVNTDPTFEELEVTVGPSPARGPEGDWGNYVRAAVAAIARLPGSDGLGGLDGCVTSDLPGAAGLSSSSALVVATASALMETHSDPAWVAPSPQATAEILALGEHYVGTRGGGMDQAASIGGDAGSVLRVEFAPVSWTTRPLPSEWVVIVAHSGVRAEKSGGARAAYNDLRRWGRSALERVALHLEVPVDFRSVRAAAPVERLLADAKRLLDPAAFAIFTHVLLEANRVEQAWAALKDEDLSAFGSAMNESHASLSAHCGVGHPRLDDLVGAARDAGAAGARLTGAGFGGCIVALAGADRGEAVLAALSRRNVAAGLDASAGPVFQAFPGAGAGVVPRHDWDR